MANFTDTYSADTHGAAVTRSTEVDTHSALRHDGRITRGGGSLPPVRGQLWPRQVISQSPS